MELYEITARPRDIFLIDLDDFSFNADDEFLDTEEEEDEDYC